MASLYTKKNETPNTRRTLADCPQWAPAEETLRRLDSEHEQIVEEGRRFDATASHQPSEQESRIGKLTHALLEKVGATKPAPAATSEGDGHDLAERRAACEAAIERHQRTMAQLRRKLEGELYREGWENEHFAARQRIAKAVVALKEAWDDERKLAIEMCQAGALQDVRYGGRLLVNFSAAAKLPNVIQTMSLPAFIESNRNLLK